MNLGEQESAIDRSQKSQLLPAVMNGTMMIKEKLDAYRRQKRREDLAESLRKMYQIILPGPGSEPGEGPRAVLLSEQEVSEVAVGLRTRSLQDTPDTDSTSSDDVEDSRWSTLTIVMYLLYFLLWATVYTIAIKFEFGAVYFVLSTLVFIWLNTHSRPKKQGELSAYSVFNPNCEAIDGTLDASQFEREIRYGLGTIH